MALREFLRELVLLYWMKRAESCDARPVDLRLAGLIQEYGVGGTDIAPAAPNPDAAKAWFWQDAETRRHIRYRAALERAERMERLGGEIDTGTLGISEHSDYDPRMFDKELREHLSTTVSSGAELLKLGLSSAQKEALTRYVIETFERLLSPSDTTTLRLSETPPERYAARKVNERLGRKENVVEFLRRVYAKEIEAGIISSSDLSSLDRTAYNALYGWNSLHQDDPFLLPQAPKERLRQVRRLEGANGSSQPV